MSSDAEKVKSLVNNAFKKNGYLCSIGFRFSQTQYDYAIALAESLFSKDKVNMFEASTGTGKTLAYLITSLLYSGVTGKKTIIATHTIALQKQMISGDLNIAMNYLDECRITRPTVEQRIGKQHYLDPIRTARKLYFMDHVNHKEIDDFLTFCVKLCTSGTGLIDDVVEAYGNIPFDLKKSDICLTNSTNDESNLAYVAAKHDAVDADIIITSHMMLLSSVGTAMLGMIEQGHNIILDEADLIINAAENITSQLIQPTFILNNLQKGRACLTTKGKECLGRLEDKLNTTIEWFNNEYSGTKLKGLITQEEANSASLQLNDIVNEVANLKKFIKRKGKELPEFGYLDDVFYTNELAADKLDNYGQLMGLHYSPVIQKPSFMVSAALPASILKYFTRKGASLFFTSATFRDRYKKGQDVTFNSFIQNLGIKEEHVGKMLSFEPSIFGSVSYILADKTIAKPFLRNLNQLSPSWLQYVSKALASIAHKREKALVLCGSFKEVIEYKKILKMTNITFHTSGALNDAVREHLENDTDLLVTPSAWEGFSLRQENNTQHFKAVVITKIPFSPPDEINQIRLSKYYSDKGILNSQQRVSATLNIKSSQLAITKLIQGAGRLLRGADDAGEIWILDPRFPHAGDTGRHSNLYNMIPIRFKDIFNEHQVWSREGKLNMSSSTDNATLIGVI
jgi:ATP-dependent DNA helicase DinG